NAIRSGLDSDIIALSGGVSKGKHDLVREVLDSLGMETLFHGIRAKPGKPALVGRLEDTLVFGLPGNPVSTYVMSVLLLFPAVRTLAGLRDPRTRMFEARLRGELPAATGRTSFHAATLAAGPGGGAEVRPVAWNGSGDLTGYAAGNCLVRMDMEAGAARDGDPVKVLLCG
ncbi:MAG: molybdopterin-binding protein, partial [Myxococcota bacterium]|nr:molybdopterin-binding protein [Myxococcota bacterium]